MSVCVFVCVCVCVCLCVRLCVRVCYLTRCLLYYGDILINKVFAKFNRNGSKTSKMIMQVTNMAHTRSI